jgi:tRNA pseudouridine55 synthase
MILNINKPIGLTSYDIIRKLKIKYPKQKIGHAGTLDPLAQGVLICLIGGESTRRQSEFMGKDKEYVFDVLFGFSTDTYDILGLPKFTPYNLDEIKNALPTLLEKYKGEIDQEVPSFSAVKVEGQTLYRSTLSGDIKENPIRKITIHNIEILETYIVEKESLHKSILSLLEQVRKGFRQPKIIESWNNLFEEIKQDKFLIVKIKSTVSKGTYVRAIANDLGKDFGCGACTTVITRTKSGEFSIEDSVNLN